MERDQVIEKVRAFLEEMSSNGIRCSVQTCSSYDGRGVHITKMTPFEALGSLEFAKEVTMQGQRSHHKVDTLVQALEARPDLVKRIKVMMASEVFVSEEMN